MTARLAQIWRYPLKAIGRERLSRVELSKGETLPFDRYWAVMHDGATKKLNEDGSLGQWLPKSAFLRAAASPALQAVSGGLSDGKLSLSHPEQGEITIDPNVEDDAERLIEWVTPLWPENKEPPARLVTAPDALTDSKKPFVSINSLDSLSELETKVGGRLGVERWRGNLWIEGAKPFAELDWIGRELTIGPARLRVMEPIGRCSAPAVDTQTGKPDHDMVRALGEHYGHSNFGVYAEVLEGGELAEMDEIALVETSGDAEQPDRDSDA
ncbi:MOSC domain-containing protein [Paracoccus aerodenitrificans]|uniref:MOSC domain-containing protein n=1 Tax=Paracoccus aerodenitrificans TaxID=3017781 RepID=UPI0022F0C91D|nr:MOSC N-terminal beta barrel domain-containing protein [Paracoccus aerodenitrificans]WBU64918.1 MOSC domain-containing protein [Paracoccus aerodenitrificans]